MHKRKQYCKQAQRALSTAIAELSDGVLLDVAELDRSRLLVTVGVWTGDGQQLERTKSELTTHSGIMRIALARSTHRKRTPQLCFMVVPLASS